MKHNAEDYLLAIWELNESYEFVNEKSVAQRLSISLPSAWEGIHRLEREKQLIVGKQGLRFTRDGYVNAMQMIRAHRITEHFAYAFLEVPWDEVHNAVMDLEHDFPDKLLSNLYRKMGSPDYCPHGNPIEPDRKMVEVSASDAPEGKYYLVRQVLEEYSFLKKLLDAGSTPGMPVRLEKGEDSLYLTGQNGELKVPIQMGRTIRLRPGDKPIALNNTHHVSTSISLENAHQL
ncbi:MAG: metal-dependent transcriptional regulator [Candidatus Thermoplasmatota archaeon]|nr:metal-dependent transcriptional regulator [Candidatus Thermoplasmatota archaeon]